LICVENERLRDTDGHTLSREMAAVNPC